MSSPRPRTSKETPGFIRQIEAADKVISFAKMILMAFAAIILWAARLQWNVADLQRQVTEITTVVKDIQDDRRIRIKDSEAWRLETDKANVKRDLLLEQLTHIAMTDKPAVRPRRQPRPGIWPSIRSPAANRSPKPFSKPPPTCSTGWCPTVTRRRKPRWKCRRKSWTRSTRPMRSRLGRGSNLPPSASPSASGWK